MKWVVDRFEGDKAVLENIKTLETTVYERGDLPEEVREGYVLQITHGRVFICEEETQQRLAEIRARFERLKKNAY